LEVKNDQHDDDDEKDDGKLREKSGEEKE